MRLSVIFTLVLSFFIIPIVGEAAFILDCGKPTKDSGFGVVSYHPTNFKIDFNIDGKVYLVSTDKDGITTRQEMWTDHITKDIRAYIVDNIRVAHNAQGIFLNISGFTRTSEYHSECK